jgi:hypothetical protein
MPARGSGLSRKALAASAGWNGPRVVGPETRLKISEALHRFYGTTPGQKRTRRKPEPKPRRQRTAAEIREAKETRLARAKARRAEKRPVGKAKRAKKPEPMASLLVVTRRRKMRKTAQLISSHTRRQNIGLTRMGGTRKALSIIHAHRRAGSHRVWKKRGES